MLVIGIQIILEVMTLKASMVTRYCVFPLSYMVMESISVTSEIYFFIHDCQFIVVGFPIQVDI